MIKLLSKVLSDRRKELTVVTSAMGDCTDGTKKVEPIHFDRQFEADHWLRKN